MPDGVQWTDIATAVASICTLLVVLAALLLGWCQLSSMETARKAQLLTDLSRRWDEELLVESRQAANRYAGGEELASALERHDQQNTKDYYVLVRLPNFFEDLGILVSEGAISPKLVAKSLRSPAKGYWALYQPYISAVRRRRQTKCTYQWFEKLVEKI